MRGIGGPRPRENGEMLRPLMEAHFVKHPEVPWARIIKRCHSGPKAELSSLQTLVIIKLMALKMCLDIKSISTEEQS